MATGGAYRGDNEEEEDRGRDIPEEPNWLTGDLGRYPSTFSPLLSRAGEVDEPLQQSDLLRPLMMDIARYGLTYAFYKYLAPADHPDPVDKKHAPTRNPKHVIVVGAGMSGLVAAYELAQVGHRVTILEMQNRLGGRVKTFDEKDGFARGLYVDGEQCNLLVRCSCYIHAVICIIAIMQVSVN